MVLHIKNFIYIQTSLNSKPYKVQFERNSMNGTLDKLITYDGKYKLVASVHQGNVAELREISEFFSTIRGAIRLSISNRGEGTSVTNLYVPKELASVIEEMLNSRAETQYQTD